LASCSKLIQYWSLMSMFYFLTAAKPFSSWNTLSNLFVIWLPMGSCIVWWITCFLFFFFPLTSANRPVPITAWHASVIAGIINTPGSGVDGRRSLSPRGVGTCAISDFRRCVNEILALLRCYTQTSPVVSYRWSNSTKSPASGARKVSEPRLMSQSCGWSSPLCLYKLQDTPDTETRNQEN